MEQISTEKKMELIRSIRAENERNKGRMRHREHILFGAAEVPPFYAKEYIDSYQSETKQPQQGEHTVSVSGLKIRFFLAVLLFVGFFILDRGKVSWNGLTSDIVQTEINKSVSANVFDFIVKLPYNLLEEEAFGSQ